MWNISLPSITLLSGPPLKSWGSDLSKRAKSWLQLKLSLPSTSIKVTRVWWGCAVVVSLYASEQVTDKV